MLFERSYKPEQLVAAIKEACDGAAKQGVKVTVDFVDDDSFHGRLSFKVTAEPQNKAA